MHILGLKLQFLIHLCVKLDECTVQFNFILISINGYSLFFSQFAKGSNIDRNCFDTLFYMILYVSNFKSFTLLYGLTMTAIEFGNFVLDVLDLNLKV